VESLRRSYPHQPRSRAYYRPPRSRAYYRPRGYGRRWHWAHAAVAVAPLGPVPSATVTWAQQALAQIFGPLVPQDGILGPETRGFVARFQAQQGLPPTGDLDDATLSALQAATASPPPVLVELPPPVGV
jgi:peptidoglycan hydrolase-like protein with peptidoglycan-binding domain